VHRRQVTVQHDDVIRREPCLLQPGGPVASHVDGDAKVTQALGDGLCHYLIVLHDQHAHLPMVPHPE
jgi:hypothetical protein